MPAIVNRIDKKISDQGKFTPCPSKDGINVTFSGVFDFKYFYYLLHEWLIEHEWAKSDSDFREDLYSQRDDVSGKELFLKWRMEKKTGNYVADKIEMDIHIHCLALGDTEILVNNKKQKLDKGEIEVKIDGRVFKNKELTSSWVYKSELIKKFMDNKYYSSQHDKVWGDFYAEIYNLQEAIKEYFGLTRFSDRRELLEFYKSRTGE